MHKHLNAFALAFLIQSLAAGGSLAAAPLTGLASIWEFQIAFDPHGHPRGTVPYQLD